jgi:hypothetical protein
VIVEAGTAKESELMENSITPLSRNSPVKEVGFYMMSLNVADQMVHENLDRT